MEWKQLLSPFLWVFACLASIAYLIIPLTNDARIYLGVEHIAASYYPFPECIDLAWEIKPIANRLINYVLYKIGILFVPFDNHFLFGVAVKCISLIVVILVAYYFYRVVRGKYTFLLVFFAFVLMANFCILQAEYWAVLFAVLAVAMLISESKFAWYLAGAAIGWIFMIKGITGLLGIPIVCGAYLLMLREDDLDPFQFIDAAVGGIKRAFFSLLGFFSIGSLFFVMWLTYWPNMISDILLSPRLARVGMVGPVNLVVWFFAQLIMSPLYIPVLVIGFIFGAIFFFAWVKGQGFDVKVAYLLMWISPAAIVVVQGEMFLYHYLAFVPSAIVTIVMCDRLSGGDDKV
jgi:hypothetical protein